jgi:outer membrane protein assembly factor BamB
VEDSVSDVIRRKMKIRRKQHRYLLIAVLSAVMLLTAAVFLCWQALRPRRTADSGTLLGVPGWTFTTADAISATPARDQSGCVFVRMANSIVALDVLSGRELWRADSPGKTPLLLAYQPPLIVALVAYGKYLVVPEGDSRLATFSTDTGELMWRAPSPNPGLSHLAAIDIRALQVSNEVAYVARFNAGLAAYRVTDGMKIWEHDISSLSDPHLAVDESAVYFGAAHCCRLLIRRRELPFGRKTWPPILGRCCLGRTPSTLLIKNGQAYLPWI